MKQRIAITLDTSLIELLKKKRIKLSSHINQLLWRELALENDKEHFHKFNNIEYKNDSWQFRDKDNELDKDFKYLYHVYNDNFEEFHNWLDKHSKGYKRNITNVLKKSFKINYRNFKDSLNKGCYSTKYYSLAFRNLINFAVEKDLLKKSESLDIKDKLKLSRSGMDLKVPIKGEVLKLIYEVKKYNIYDYIFIRLLFESGLRVSDILFFLNKFTKENVEVLDKLFICPLYNFRGSKSSFYCIALKETLELLFDHYNEMKEYNCERLKTYIKRNNLLSLKYLRKYNFTLMIENELNFEIANFIQGRASQNIGFNHYLAKKKLSITEFKKIQETLLLHLK